MLFRSPLCEEEAILLRDPLPTVADVEALIVSVFKRYLPAKAKDKEEHEIAQIRLVRYAGPEFISALQCQLRGDLQKQLVNLLIDWTNDNPLHASLIAATIKEKGLPTHHLHDKLTDHLEAQMSIQPDQETVLRSLQVSIDEGVAFTSILNAGYQKMSAAMPCFAAGLECVKFLSDSMLQRDWKLRVLDLGCPCLERAETVDEIDHCKYSSPC